MAQRHTGFSVNEIAKLAGVSTATVSRVLNYKDNVTKDTSEKVLGVLESLGCNPHLLKNEVKLDSKLILMNIQTFHNPACGSVIDGARVAALRNGYQLILVQSENVDKSLTGYESLMKLTNAAGMLLMDDLIDEEMLNILNYRFPFVLTVTTSANENLSSVSIDDKAAAITAMNYLLSIGRRKIALLNSSLEYIFARHREDGYRQVLEKAGIPVKEKWIAHLHPDFKIESAVAASESILQSDDRPDAFFAVSDVYAASILRVCNRLKISVPEEVAIIGFDNTDITTLTEPTLTTMSQPAFQIGHMACSLLIDKISDAKTRDKRILLESELIIRGST